jgi:ribosome-interacting GTPase 1
MGILEKIADIENEINRTQKNKGTWFDLKHLIQLTRAAFITK